MGCRMLDRACQRYQINYECPNNNSSWIETDSIITSLKQMKRRGEKQRSAMFYFEIPSTFCIICLLSWLELLEGIYFTSQPEDVDSRNIIDQFPVFSETECMSKCKLRQACSRSGVRTYEFDGSRRLYCVFLSAEVLPPRAVVKIRRVTVFSEKHVYGQHFRLRFNHWPVVCLQSVNNKIVLHRACSQTFFFTESGCLRLSSGECIDKLGPTDERTLRVVARCADNCGLTIFTDLLNADKSIPITADRFVLQTRSEPDKCVHVLNAVAQPPDLHPVIFHPGCLYTFNLVYRMEFI